MITLLLMVSVTALSLAALYTNKAHYLTSLVLLEWLVLTTTLEVTIMISGSGLLTPVVVLLSVSVAAAALGVCLLIKVSKTFGADMLSVVSTC